MKIDRLLGILTTLLERESVTAPELAERFEVSRRTINRDIDTLDRAGFPIVTRQGVGGGISLLEGFRFDGKVIRKGEMEKIVTGLKGLASISSNSSIDLLLSRLGSQSDEAISIDLSSFYKGSLSEKIELFSRAINEQLCVKITYFSPEGEDERIIEPLQIHFRWSNWYLSAYCRLREDFRYFKLNRLWNVELTGTAFDRRDNPEEKEEPGQHLKDEIPLEVLFDKSVKYLVVEAYGPSSFTQIDEDKLHFKRGYTNHDFILSWLLGFGDKAKVLKPESLAQEIREIAENILKT